MVSSYFGVTYVFDANNTQKGTRIKKKLKGNYKFRLMIVVVVVVFFGGCK